MSSNIAKADSSSTEETADLRPDQELTDASLRSKHFGERTDPIWGVASPVAVRGLEIKKDETNSSEQNHATAPTLITSIIGPWLARKLGCAGPPPKVVSDGTSSDMVVSNVNLVLNPGEATLIIAPSSSGKTSLMRAIADLCEGRSVPSMCKGRVLIGGLDPTAEENKGCFRRSTAFADQGDLTLTPVLTVEETVSFASSCANNFTSEKLNAMTTAILRLAGLSHVKSTVVGDANIRGVSGGQKRRVKVLEKASGDEMRVLFLDEITNGLDAASALASCENITVAAKKTGITAMVSLLQPSVDMYNCFDRVLVLTQQGEVAYSGLRQGALEHFESQGLIKPVDMDEPEFLLRSAFKPSEFLMEDNSCQIQSSSDLVKSFASSPSGQALLQDLDAAESTRAQEHPTVKTDFARTWFQQLGLLLGRGWKLVMRNPGTFVRIFFIIVFGLFVGTLFLGTAADEAGTRTRAGYTYTTILLIFMTAIGASIEGYFADRGTFYCHRQARFYSTTAYYVSAMICSWPLAFVESTLMALCSFFLVGMESSGGTGFLYFWLIIFLLSLTGNAIGRVLSYSMPSTDIATSLAPAVNIVFSLTAGFAPQYKSLGWLRFMNWISPVSYAFEGLLINELHNRDMAGSGESGTNFGLRVLGMPRVPYEDAIPAMSSPGRLMAFDAALIFCWVVFFEIIACVLLHVSQKWYGPTTKRYQVTSGECLGSGKQHSLRDIISKQKLSAFSAETHKALGLTGESVGTTTAVPPAPLVHLTATNMVYEVDFKSEEKDEKKKGQTQEAAELEGRRGLVTARDYGQPGRGVAQEWVLASLRHSMGSSVSGLTQASSSHTNANPRLGLDGTIDKQEAMETGQIADLGPPAEGRLRLLSGVSASFKPKSMTALMGSSGAGKTTLLDVLAGYKTGGYTTGDICLNGQAKSDKTWKAIAGYCEQSDLHNPAMTVRESLLFAARMRLQPFSLPEAARVAHCEDMMKLLEIEEYADLIVGDEAAGEGLPKHARKRLTLGVELVANPSVLFADEPTSGLDSVSASLVVSSLKRAAHIRSVTVVCTIHQPSKEVFEAFDNLLLLRKGGEVVYNGPISEMDEYMTSVTGNDEYSLPQGCNPADHALDIFCGPGGEKDDWGELYKQSTMAKNIADAIEEQARQKGEVKCDHHETMSFFQELRQVLGRQILTHWRTPTYMAVRFWWTCLATLFIGIIFMGIPSTIQGAQDLIGAIFCFVNMATVPLTSAAIPLIAERAVFYRETSSATYSKTVYGLAVQLAEVPFNIGMAFLSFIIYYWLVGLDNSGEKVVYFLLMTLAAYWVLPLYGQLFSFLSPNLGIASALGGLLLTGFSMTMGFLIAPTEIPVWWSWLYWVNPLRYILQGVAVNELGGNLYLDEDADRYVLGDDLLHALGGWSSSEKWFYCYFAILMFGFVGSAGLMLATRINWMKR